MDEFKLTMRYVLGASLGSFKDWYTCMKNKASVAGTDVGSFIIAGCTAVLMEIGEPPFPIAITQNLFDAATPRMAEHTSRRWANKHEAEIRAQYKWNRQFNDWVIEHSLYGSHRSQGPAQMRKFFAAWWLLHRCKQYGVSVRDSDAITEKTGCKGYFAAAEEVAKIRNALRKRK